jgi:hypothetical protein
VEKASGSTQLRYVTRSFIEEPSFLLVENWGILVSGLKRGKKEGETLIRPKWA